MTQHEGPHPNGGSPGGVVGAAMVVGGGVAGMQAALDLANSGIKVYLVETSPAIGGRMAQLDKTFPTNDCAMCTISPKLVECGRHLNIEVLTTSELVGLEGKVGNFTAVVHHRPRHVDPLKCTACGECSKACPIHVPSEYDAGLVTRNAAYRPYVQAVPSAFAIDKKGTAPCKAACPAGCSAQGYIALAADGRYQEALDLVRETIPFPAVCGRVCVHPCEANCRRAQVDEPVSIMSIKRFLSDWERNCGVAPPPTSAPTGERVAVIGAGPAGLTAAQDLAVRGYRVTIFEALPVAGGMMRVGIPASRLPKDVLQRDVDFILGKGVELRTGVKIGADLRWEDLRGQGFKATYVAVGAHVSQKLGIPGEDLKGVIGGTDMLREVNLGQRSALGDRVAVVGGGDTAMDAARVALRLGAKEVTLVYRRSAQEMPASPWEVEDAKHEGVKFHYLAAPVEVIGANGRVSALRCVKMELGEPDASGRRAPKPVAGSEFDLPVDVVVPAVSQSSALHFLPPEIKLTKSGKIAVDPASLASSVPGVFAGGDVVEGRATIVHAIAAGHKAAAAIDRYLRGEQDLSIPEPILRPVADTVEPGKYQKAPRAPMPALSLAGRHRGFAEVETGFDEAALKAEVARCLKCGLCSECYACVKACKPQAIDHEEQPRVDRIKVGAVVLAPGYDLIDSKHLQEFGLGRYKNVLSALQFERMLSASGPTGGHVQRPSDQVEPKRVAFLQCVGCRDRERKYCSSVCCMYATKEAVMAKEHVQGLDTQIFLMDIRAFGKGFDAYVDRAKNEVGVKYIRSRPSSVKENPANGNLIIRFQSEEGALVDEEFDLVVLSTAIVPSAGGQRLAQSLGLELDDYGFCRTPKFAPLETNIPGVFACGPFSEPMDIPDSVVQASGAAAKALQLLASARGTLVQEKIYPPETVVEPDDDARVGVFVCHCGTNIAGVVDVEAVRQHALALPGVVHAERLMYSCSQDSIELIKQRVREQGLTRVVVASCTPRTHEPLFQDSIREAGLNEYLFEMANIRDQCSWVHAKEPPKATAKAKDLVRMAVARAKKLRALHKQSLGLTSKAVVLGGGVAGLTASLALSRQGYPVYLVEREAELGGHMRNLRYTSDGDDPRDYLKTLLDKVAADANVEVITGHTVVKSTGFVGNYRTTIADREGRQRLLEHGVTIVATGAREYRGNEYLLGQNPGVLTQQQLEQRLVDEPKALEGIRNVVMIQCVGPGGENPWYCSRVCCTVAVKNALKIKELNPSTNVVVLYKDMRTFGRREHCYTQAREKGVMFLRYVDSRKPEVVAGERGLSIAARDEANNEDVLLPADLLVLTEAIVPAAGAEEVAPALKVPLSREGFFLEAHIKLRPVDFASEGIFLCGSAHYPKFIEESIAQALAASARASTILSKSFLEVGGVVAHVDPEKCAACLTCVRVCPYHVPVITSDGVAVINEAECHGCGTCTSECPSRAITLMHYGDDQVEIKADALLMGVA